MVSVQVFIPFFHSAQGQQDRGMQWRGRSVQRPQAPPCDLGCPLQAADWSPS